MTEDGDRQPGICQAFEESALQRAVIVVGDQNGRKLTWRRDLQETNSLRLASASKWLAAATIMRIVEEGDLSLQTRLADVFSWAHVDDSLDRGLITLEQLLSFTAGFEVTPLETTCADHPAMTLEVCARQLYQERHVAQPGKEFFYGPAPLQIAAAMAVAVTGERWNELFRSRIADPVGMTPETQFWDSSPSHPRISSGVRASTADIELFLQALLKGDLLADSHGAMLRDYTPAASVRIRSSPATDFFYYDWHYSLGTWLECPRRKWNDDCDGAQLISSVGAYGFYPWIDFERGVYGIVGRDDFPVVAYDEVVLQTGAHSVRMITALRPQIYSALERLQ